MKKKTLYSSEYITFWPQYTYGKIGIVFVLALTVISLLPFLLELFDDLPKSIPWHSMLFPLAVIAVSLLSWKYIRAVMYEKIVFSHLGIEISNAVTHKNEKYAWSDIASVWFYRDGWHGRESLLVWLKDSPRQQQASEPCGTTIHGGGSQKLPPEPVDEVISISGLDKNKLLEFIPRDLYRNNPKMAWFDVRG